MLEYECERVTLLKTERDNMSQEWEHNGTKCRIDLDVEDDNIKKWFLWYDESSGWWQIAPIGPYEPNETLDLWLDAGRPWPSPSWKTWTYQDLKERNTNRETA